MCSTKPLCFPTSGAREFLTEAISYVPDFYTHVKEDYDNNKEYAVRASPSHNLVMNGSQVCTLVQPDQFSLLFKFRAHGPKFAVKLLEIEDQLAVTLDLCNMQLIVDYGGESCDFRNIALSLKEDLTVGDWHKIGLSFADDHLALFVNCRLVEWRLVTNCSHKCDESTSVSIIAPNEQLASCNADGEVSGGGRAGGRVRGGREG